MVVRGIPRGEARSRGGVDPEGGGSIPRGRAWLTPPRRREGALSLRVITVRERELQGEEAQSPYRVVMLSIICVVTVRGRELQAEAQGRGHALYGQRRPGHERLAGQCNAIVT